ncbi:MAG: hypothetical protein ABSE87_10005 [Terracidiphilus sp.]|jgi:hypothetical protein
MGELSARFREPVECNGPAIALEQHPRRPAPEKSGIRLKITSTASAKVDEPKRQLNECIQKTDMVDAVYQQRWVGSGSRKWLLEQQYELGICFHSCSRRRFQLLCSLRTEAPFLGFSSEQLAAPIGDVADMRSLRPYD